MTTHRDLAPGSTVDLQSFYALSSASYDEDYAALGYSDDVAFYRDLAVESGGPVLETGCGTGRILLPTARAGIRIHGIDSSPDMLAVLRRKLESEPKEVRHRITLSQGDVRDAQVDGKFELVTAPFRVAQHLLKRVDQRAWLRNVKRHLAPGSTLVFDVFQPDFSRFVAPSEWNLEIDRTDPQSGHRLRRYARTVPHNALQLVDVEMRYVAETATGEPVSQREGHFTFRWYTRGELESLLELEGFEVLDYWGSFRREPFGESSKQQIIRARVP
jgi:SAM-dependent methyltransferase